MRNISSRGHFRIPKLDAILKLCPSTITHSAPIRSMNVMNDASKLRSFFLTDDVDNDDDIPIELEEAAAAAAAGGLLPKKEIDESSVALAAVPNAPLRFSESIKGGLGVNSVTGQISANGLMIINENGEEERRTVTAIFAGAERCRRYVNILI